MQIQIITTEDQFRTWVANVFMDVKNEPPKTVISDRCNIQEAADVTGLSKSALYKLTMNNEIPFSKFGNRLVFSRKELQNWIESKTIECKSKGLEHLKKSALKKGRK